MAAYSEKCLLGDCAVVAAAAPKPVKVILETGLLDKEQKIIACSLSKIAGAAYVKTSTGFGHGGATVEDIELMRAVVGPEMGVKASGGVRTVEDAHKMLAAGPALEVPSLSGLDLNRRVEGQGGQIHFPEK